MSQTFTTIASTDTLTASRSLINDNFSACRSSFSGTSAPSSPTPVEGQLFAKTDTNVLQIYTGSSWVTVVPDYTVAGGGLIAATGGTMSGALATPCSSIRMASAPIATPSRDVAKPGKSLTTIAVFPSSAANASPASTEASDVRTPRTTSSSSINGTGLKKCNPTTREGSRTTDAISGAVCTALAALPISATRSPVRS